MTCYPIVSKDYVKVLETPKITKQSHRSLLLPNICSWILKMNDQTRCPNDINESLQGTRDSSLPGLNELGENVVKYTGKQDVLENIIQSEYSEFLRKQFTLVGEAEERSDAVLSDESSDLDSSDSDDYLKLVGGESKSINSDNDSLEVPYIEFSGPSKPPIFLSSGIQKHCPQNHSTEIFRHISSVNEENVNKQILTPQPSLNSMYLSRSFEVKAASEELRHLVPAELSLPVENNTNGEKVENQSDKTESVEDKLKPFNSAVEGLLVDSSLLSSRQSELSPSGQTLLDSSSSIITKRRCSVNIDSREDVDFQSSYSLNSLSRSVNSLPPNRDIPQQVTLLLQTSLDQKSSYLDTPMGLIEISPEGNLDEERSSLQIDLGTSSYDQMEPILTANSYVESIERVLSNTVCKNNHIEQITNIVEVKGNLSNDLALLSPRIVRFEEGIPRVFNNISLVTGNDWIVDERDEINENNHLKNICERESLDDHSNCNNISRDIDVGSYGNIGEDSKSQQLILDSIKSNNLVSALSLTLIQLEHDKVKHGPYSKQVGVDLHNIAVLRMRLGQYKEAMPVSLEAVRVKERVYGSSDPEVVSSIIEVGVILFALEEFDRALVCFKRALEIRRRSFGGYDADMAKVLNNIACVYLELDELEKAMEAFSECLNIKVRILTKNPDDSSTRLSLGAMLCNVACLLVKKKHYHSAIEAFNEALALQKSCFLDEHQSTWTVMENIAYCYLKIHEYKMALSYYERLLEVQLKHYGENSPDYYRITRYIALIHVKNGDFDEAFIVLSNLVEVLKTDSQYWHDEASIRKTTRLLEVVKAKQAKKMSVDESTPYLNLCSCENESWSTSSDSLSSDTGTVLQLLTSFKSSFPILFNSRNCFAS